MSTESTLKSNLLAGLVAIVVMVAAFFVFSGGSDEQAELDIAAEAPATQATAPVTDPTPAEAGDDAVDDIAADDSEAASEASDAEAETAPATFSNLPTITIDELPFEAIETLLLIDDGGPYPYRQDDGTFQNREGILPDREIGHYREYTVDTPGSPDRGARRIVSGADGERYYTDDHYDSFREITP